jgi:hypothetical protein
MQDAVSARENDVLLYYHAHVHSFRNSMSAGWILLEGRFVTAAQPRVRREP